MVVAVTILYLKSKGGHYTIKVIVLHFLTFPALPRLTSCSPLPSDLPWDYFKAQVLDLVLPTFEGQVQGSSAWSLLDSRAELS